MTGRRQSQSHPFHFVWQSKERWIPVVSQSTWRPVLNGTNSCSQLSRAPIVSVYLGLGSSLTTPETGQCLLTLHLAQVCTPWPMSAHSPLGPYCYPHLVHADKFLYHAQKEGTVFHNLSHNAGVQYYEAASCNSLDDGPLPNQQTPAGCVTTARHWRSTLSCQGCKRCIPRQRV